jgi:hypothetical protein
MLPSVSVPPGVKKAALIGVAAAVVLGVLSLLLVKLGGEPRLAASSTTVDPKVPPPIGQLPLGSRTTTSAAPGLAAGWIAYKSPDGTFTANFPGPAKARGFQRTFGTLTQNGLEAFLQVGTDGPAYSVGYVELLSAASFADSQDFFDQAMTDAYDDAGPFEVPPGLQAVSFTRKPRAGPPSRGFVLLKGKRVYFVESVDATDEDFQIFISGFHWAADPLS